MNNLWRTVHPVESGFRFVIASPQLEFAEYPNQHFLLNQVFCAMVADLVTIRVDQGREAIPVDVRDAAQRLIRARQVQGFFVLMDFSLDG